MKYSQFDVMKHCSKCKEELKNHDWDTQGEEYILTKFGVNCNYPFKPFEDQQTLDNYPIVEYAQVSTLTQLCVLCGEEVGQFNDGLHITRKSIFKNGQWVCAVCFDEIKEDNDWKEKGYYSP